MMHSIQVTKKRRLGDIEWYEIIRNESRIRAPLLFVILIRCSLNN